MAKTQGQIGFGTTIHIGDGASPEVYTKVGELYELSEVGAEKELVKMTHHDSPNRFQEYILGLADGSQITCAANFIKSDTGQAAIRTAFDAEGETSFRVIGPTGAQQETLDFGALVMSHNVDRPLEDRQAFNFTLKITGPITYS